MLAFRQLGTLEVAVPGCLEIRAQKVRIRTLLRITNRGKLHLVAPEKAVGPRIQHGLNVKSA